MKFIKNIPLLMTILLVSLFSCNKEEESLSGLQGIVSFGGISLEFVPMGSPGERISGNSTWVHVFPSSADLIFTNKVTREQYTLEYNPNDFSAPYSITLPYGAYEYQSIVEGGIFSAFLPFEARGEFFLDSHNLEISLKAETEYGLVTLKDQYVEKASISNGDLESDLLENEDGDYWYMYVKGGTENHLVIKESFKGSTINRGLSVAANKHYNFVLKVNEGAAVITDLTMAPFELDEEEIIIGSNAKFFEENGTIKCPGASPGEKGIVNNHTYEAVDRALLIQRRDEGAELSCVCTSLVTDMSDMFNRIQKFNHPIGEWDVSNVINMNSMFYAAFAFNQPIGNWDVGKVMDMSNMFYFSGFNQPIGNWNVSNVKNMSNMFRAITGFNQPIGNWDVSNVTNLSGMFSEAYTFNQPIGNWDVSNVTDMSGMFYAVANFNQPIGKWNVSKVITMFGMFSRAASFNQPIGDWDVKNVNTMTAMFSYASSFNQPIGNWDVSNVTSMEHMFITNSFNQPIGNWNVRNVTNMRGMFLGAGSFNQSIGNWNVSNVTNMSDMFAAAKNFNQPIANWNVGNVKDMSYMFFHATNFNQPIGNWDVISVTNMNQMFEEANKFNQIIGAWDVSEVTNMSSMFLRAFKFNQDLSSWCVKNIPSEPDDFSISSAIIEFYKPIWGTCPD